MPEYETSEFASGLRISLLLVLCMLGALGMGLQLVASRVLAPHFGSSIFVWAWLISTFLAAFSVGSFWGGMVSSMGRSRQMRWVFAGMALTVATLVVDSIAGQSFCSWLEDHVEALLLQIPLACMGLYFMPVMTLSSITPICIRICSGKSAEAGLSSGLVYGTSTVGNIVGVMLTAFVLIPRFPLSQIMYGWTAAAILLLGALWFIIFQKL